MGPIVVGGKGSRVSTGSGPESGTWECRKGSEGSSLPLTIKKPTKHKYLQNEMIQ